MNVELRYIQSLCTAESVCKPQWVFLCDAWNAMPVELRGGISLGHPFRPTATDVIEHIGDTTTFWYQRDIAGAGRKTTIDRYGLIGLSAINPSDRRYILTEGVSDFLTLKLCYPKSNILGFTSLGGNVNATKILLTLADSIIYITDNDAGKESNTGLKNAVRLKQHYERFGKRVYLQLPTAPFKDITQQVINDLKFA